MKKIGIILIGAVIALVLGGVCISSANQDTVLRNQFNQKLTERTAFYDKMWKTLSQKTQISLRNDSSFRENVNVIMQGRKDAPGLFMKWVTETNPNANFAEVTALYKDLSRAVEAQREGFFEQEKMLQDIKLQDDNLISKFPNTMFFAMIGRRPLVYKPITSDRTDRVIQSGKDNEVNLFY